MKCQVWFQTDLGYEATKTKLHSSGMIVGDSLSSKGRFTFYLKDFKDITFQITTKDKLGVYYPEKMDYKRIVEKIKPFLVKPDGDSIEIMEIIKEPSKIKDFGATEKHEKRLDSIRVSNLSNPFLAYFDLLFFISTLPFHIRNIVESEIQQTTLTIIMINKKLSWQLEEAQEKKGQIVSLFVLYFINRISALLHEQNDVAASQREYIDFYFSFINWLETNKEKINEGIAEAIKKAFTKPKV